MYELSILLITFVSFITSYYMYMEKNHWKSSVFVCCETVTYRHIWTHFIWNLWWWIVFSYSYRLLTLLKGWLSLNKWPHYSLLTSIFYIIWNIIDVLQGLLYMKSNSETWSMTIADISEFYARILLVSCFYFLFGVHQMLFMQYW